MGWNPLEDVGDFFQGAWDDVRGKTAIRANERAMQLQNDAAMAGVDLQRETTDLIRGDLQPYREAGLPAANRLLELATTSGQRNFIENNPFFDYLTENASNQLFSNQAARGKLGSGETAKGLQDAVYGIGGALLGDERNQLMNLASMGQNAAAMSGHQSQTGSSNITGLLLGNANAQGAGTIANANAMQAGRGNLLQAGVGLAQFGMKLLCDVRLKENIEYIEDRHGLGWYRWDWTDEAKSLVGNQPPEGPLAQEVEALRPEAVATVNGYLTVDMGVLENAA